MSARRIIPLAGAATVLAAISLSNPADAVTREEVMATAKGFAYHPWTCTAANLTASCSGAYHSVYVPGDYMGLPYDWGGFMSAFSFDQQIAAGYGAGSFPNDGVLACTSGLDCSGFVSQCWDTGHFTTSSIPDITSTIGVNSLLAGDAMNDPGWHVVLWSHELPNGDPVFYEAVGFNTHLSMPGWSWVNGFDPVRYDSITGSSAGNPAGTVVNPIPINSLPYNDSRNTASSPSDYLDGCGDSPGTNESGPEYVYAVNITQPGQLTVQVQDGAGVDIDVHLYTSMNTSDCIDRHDSSFTTSVDCGTYYIVADTYGGEANAGAYTLTVTFNAGGGNCGAGPPGYDFEGPAGDDCTEAFPYCNPTLGGDACLMYSDTQGFCSHPCATNADCADMPNGCCGEITGGETWCYRQDFCGGGGTGGTGVGGGAVGGSGVGNSGTGGGVVGGGAVGGSGVGNNGTGAGVVGDDDDDDDDDEGGCTCSAVGHQGQPPVGWLLLGAFGLGVPLARRHRLRYP